MADSVKYNFNNTITERDMDLFLAEALSTDKEFCRMLLDKTDLRCMDFTLVALDVSKTETDLGESDVTLIIEADGDRYGILIEDKIDAIAMRDQHARYLKRGEKGVERGDYADYRVFIFCPEKYRSSNKEAQLYEYLLTYEECRDYFSNKDDLLSMYRTQQLNQAIGKAKRPASEYVDEEANAFFRQYARYKQENYPSLDLRTKESSSGWWPKYRTSLKSVYIHHKMLDGSVDLTFPGTAERYDEICRIAEWARYHGMPDAEPAKRGKAAAVRIKVPAFNMKTDFESVKKADLEKCFAAIQQLTELADMIVLAYSLASGERK